MMFHLQNDFKSVPYLSIFWRQVRSVGINSSLNLWQNSCWGHLGMGFSLLERFFLNLILFSFSTDIFTASIDYWFSFSRFCIFKNLSFSDLIFPQIIAHTEPTCIFGYFLDIPYNIFSISEFTIFEIQHNEDLHYYYIEFSMSDPTYMSKIAVLAT